MLRVVALYRVELDSNQRALYNSISYVSTAGAPHTDWRVLRVVHRVVEVERASLEYFLQHGGGYNPDSRRGNN